MPASSTPPWHLWGSDATVKIERPTADPVTPNVTVQLTRISYKRPETWTFLLWAEIIQPSVLQPIVGPYFFQIAIEFQITVGVGRVAHTIVVPQWNFDPNVTSFSGVDPRQRRVATAFEAYPLRDAPIGGLSDAPNIIQRVCAQDIQCNALVFTGGQPDTGTSITLNVGAMFAPRTHTRPDWFHHDFLGGELRGT